MDVVVLGIQFDGLPALGDRLFGDIGLEESFGPDGADLGIVGHEGLELVGDGHGANGIAALEGVEGFFGKLLDLPIVQGKTSRLGCSSSPASHLTPATGGLQGAFGAALGLGPVGELVVRRPIGAGLRWPGMAGFVPSESASGSAPVTCMFREFRLSWGAAVLRGEMVKR